MLETQVSLNIGMEWPFCRTLWVLRASHGDTRLQSWGPREITRLQVLGSPQVTSLREALPLRRPTWGDSPSPPFSHPLFWLSALF